MNMSDIVSGPQKGVETTAQKIGEATTTVTGKQIEPIFLTVAAVGALVFAGALVVGVVKAYAMQ